MRRFVDNPVIWSWYVCAGAAAVAVKVIVTLMDCPAAGVTKVTGPEEVVNTAVTPLLDGKLCVAKVIG